MLIMLTVLLGGTFTQGSHSPPSDPPKSVVVTVDLSNGDRLSGPIVSQDDHSVTIDHPVLGHVTLPKVERAPSAISTPPPAGAGVEDGLPSAPVLVKSVNIPKSPPDWNGKAGLSLNYTNNTQTSINARLSGGDFGILTLLTSTGAEGRPSSTPAPAGGGVEIADGALSTFGNVTWPSTG